MTRAPDRNSKLAAFVEQRAKEPFEWGKNDCCLFVCDAILAMTGEDIAPRVFRGGYNDALGGYRLIKQYTRGGGVEQIAEQLAAENGLVEIAPPFMQRGDPVLYRDEEAGDALGICVGIKIAIVHRDTGLIYKPAHTAVRAWRVP